MQKSLLYLFIVVCVVTKAQNNVRIYSAQGELFKLFINTKLYNVREQATVLVTDIDDDTLSLKIEFERGLIVNKKIFLLEKSKPTQHKEFTYKVEKQNKKLTLNFISINEIQKIISPIVPKKPVADTSNKYRNTILGHFCELIKDKPIYFNNTPKEGICEKEMPQEYVNYIAILMSKTEVPDDKFIILENVFKNNCITVKQTETLLNYIDFEIEKLKLVKIAYYNIVDKTNTKNLENGFKFESSKKELTKILIESKNKKQSKQNNCAKEMEDVELKSLTNKLSVFNNDAERFELLKKLHINYCYSTLQTKELLVLFIRDREKLDAAQLLYYYCVDKQNYSSLTAVFSYKQTENDLLNFIEKQQ